MTPAAGLILLATSLVSADSSLTKSTYQAALQDAEAKNRPLVVLVGADWCPGCRTMKQHVLPALARRGALGGVSVATVDADANQAVAHQLMRGTSIPQLIVFSRTASGWKREQLTGAANEASVEALISRAIATQAPSQAAADSAIGN
jgi:thioredoxin-like negative regulator of GroEL